MAAKIRSILVMNGTEVRTLGELRDNFGGDSLVGCLRDDRLAVGAALLAGGAVSALLGAALGGIICAALDDDDLDLFSDCA